MNTDPDDDPKPITEDPWQNLPEDDPSPASPVGRASDGSRADSGRPYELMVILNPEIDERTVASSLSRFLKVITNDGGSIENIDIWGRRRLAYEIQRKTEGIYVVVEFTANSDATQELDRQLKLSDTVMRTKILRAEEAIARVETERRRVEQKEARSFRLAGGRRKR